GLRGLELKSVTLDGDMLKVVLKATGNDITFEGQVAKAGADTILGAFELNGRLMMGRMALTDKTELTPANGTVRPPVPEPMQKLQTLTREVAQLRQRAAQAQAKDEKAKLAKEMADADKRVQDEQPKVYREVIEK